MAVVYGVSPTIGTPSASAIAAACSAERRSTGDGRRAVVVLVDHLGGVQAGRPRTARALRRGLFRGSQGVAGDDAWSLVLLGLGGARCQSAGPTRVGGFCHPGTVDELHQQAPRGEEVGPSVAGDAGAVAGRPPCGRRAPARPGCVPRHRDRLRPRRRRRSTGDARRRRCVEGARCGWSDCCHSNSSTFRFGGSRSIASVEARVRRDVEVLRHERRHRDRAWSGTAPAPPGLDEEPHRLVQVGDGERGMVGVRTPETRAAAGQSPDRPGRWSRTSSCGWSTTCSTEPPFAAFSARSIAMRPISAMGCRTVVSGGLLAGAERQTVETHDRDVAGDRQPPRAERADQSEGDQVVARDDRRSAAHAGSRALRRHVRRRRRRSRCCRARSASFRASPPASGKPAAGLRRCASPRCPRRSRSGGGRAEQVVQRERDAAVGCRRSPWVRSPDSTRSMTTSRPPKPPGFNVGGNDPGVGRDRPRKARTSPAWRQVPGRRVRVVLRHAQHQLVATLPRSRPSWPSRARRSTGW